MTSLISCAVRLSYKKTIFLNINFYSTQTEHVSKKKIAKVVNVAIIGAPNSGKSTLINNIVERKVSFLSITYLIYNLTLCNY